MEDEKMTLDCITIEDMVSNIFTNQNIKKRRKDIVDYYRAKFDVSLFGESDSDNISEEDIIKKVDAVLKEDKNSTDPYLKNVHSQYQKTKRKSKPIDPTSQPDTNYLGKAGECIVMGELLFRGYNVNSMMVDEGIDLVASKNNVFFYIQVKTTCVSEKNRFYFKINKDRFNTYIGTQMRYILVARCSLNNEERTICFKFTNDDIERFLHDCVIPKPSDGSSTLSIKIEYDERTGKAHLYDGKTTTSVAFNMNNFNL